MHCFLQNESSASVIEDYLQNNLGLAILNSTVVLIIENSVDYRKTCEKTCFAFQDFAPRVVVMYVIALLAFLFYISKVPERYFPGRFLFSMVF
jgi:hypothetical protein